MSTTKSELNRRRERELIDAGGYRLPGGTLPPTVGAALRRIMARGFDRSNTVAIGRALVLLDQLQARMNELKPGEIPFALSVMVDKAAALDGRNALQNASVNIQVNNYGVSAKGHLLGELDGLGLAKQREAQAVEVTA